ncbi:S-adenosyl-L-methionine-dependent methyltransferase [Cercophora newfieldiana]|uniref:S-adenosyl-L-methionine-dependent methyltransferase n=1 Tax=Cercophora newfieldiana TaxID=92897 RepID=A0AA40CNU5_9PEZI|nr:S-adenosyl-L-methionine-dependent methyltransferase [Cercophora newfieldiana]
MAGTSEQVDIEVDPLFDQPDNDDTNSALGSEAYVSPSPGPPTSSTILEYRKLHGRTYQNFGGGDNIEYGPNDQTQNEQLDINHHLLTLGLGGKLYLAPIEKPTKVLDVGTGTGIWAIDFADEFPDAEATGIDISPIQPSWVPTNCKFIIDDAAKSWTYPDNTFGYIHIRYLTGCFKDWVSVYSEAYRCLKPGGWIEYMDCAAGVYCDDGSMGAKHIFQDWVGIFKEAGPKMGQTFEVIDGDNYLRWLEKAGFKNISKKDLKMPVGAWPADKTLKEIGGMNRASLEMGIEGFGLYVLTNVLGWKFEEVQAFLTKVRDGLKNRSYHGYCLWGTAWAQKPLE